MLISLSDGGDERMSTYVIAGDDRKQYAYERKLHQDHGIRSHQERNLQGIILHNGYRTEEVERDMRRYKFSGSAYFPERSTERHFYDQHNGVLHVVNPRGMIRLERDKDLVEALQEVWGRTLELEIDHYQGNAAKAQDRFMHFAFNLADEMIQNLEGSIYNGSTLFILMGPYHALAEQHLKISKQNTNDYLNYRILHVGGKTVLNLDYIFGDQAEHVLSKLYGTISASYTGVRINVFHYGKIGTVERHLEIGDVGIPTGALDDHRLEQRRISPIWNQLALDTEARSFLEQRTGRTAIEGKTVNTISVLRQTTEILQQAKEAGGSFLDMEWAVMASLDHASNSRYPNLGEVKHFFAGVVSDNPLMGKNLGNIPHPYDYEANLAEAMVKLIEHIEG
ncbi:hypothetical protein HZB02_00050 [Candidatus Woesearchaeota archaeon]|nr:hypothetical protein [Candidatus Woesearchaeota archaeon]